MRSRYSAAPQPGPASDAAIEGKLGWVTESTEAQAEFTESNSLARIRLGIFEGNRRFDPRDLGNLRFKFAAFGTAFCRHELRVVRGRLARRSLGVGGRPRLQGCLSSGNTGPTFVKKRVRCSRGRPLGSSETTFRPLILTPIHFLPGVGRTEPRWIHPCSSVIAPRRSRRPRLCYVARDTSAACPVWNATRRIRIRGGPLRLQQALA